MFDPEVSSVNDLHYDANGRTYSYEALNEVHPKSRFRRDSYQRSINHDERFSTSSAFLQSLNSKDAKGSSHPTSGIAINFRNPEEKIMGKVIEGVIRYSLNTSRPKGSMGRLVLTNVRLKFINYNEVDASEVKDKLLPPFDIHSFMDESLESGTQYDEDIDFLSVYRVEEYKKDGIHVVLTVYCLDFRRIEFQIKENEDSRILIDQLIRMVSPTIPSSSSSSSAASTLVKNMSSSNILSTGMFSTGSSSSAAVTVALIIKKVHELPLLWYELTTDHPYFDRKEWEEREGYWMSSNPITRITQCNETFQVSKTLPKCFLTLSSVLLSDVTLMQSISTQMTGQRVPLITFSVPVAPVVRLKKQREERLRDFNNKKKQSLQERPSSYGYSLSKTLNRSTDLLSEMISKGKGSKGTPPSPRMVRRTRSRTLTRTASAAGSTTLVHDVNDHHFLFRSVHLTEDVSNLLRDKVSPLKVYDFNKEFPKGLPWFEKAHKKLLEAIFATTTRNFIWNTGKWMKRVSRVLRIVSDVVDSLRNESSVVLTEESDNLFNPLISTLVQVVLDQNRRTIIGFEALLSKEWMFLTGFANGYPNSMRSPNPVMFFLLIDCLHQLIAFKSNGLSFEFTSLYLIRLFDRQLIPSVFSALSPTPPKNLAASFEDLTMTGPNSPHGSSSLNPRMLEIRRRSSVQSRLSSVNNFIINSQHCLPLTIIDMCLDQLLFMYNPLFDSGNNGLSRLNMSCSHLDHIPVPRRAAELNIFEGLYLRWLWVGENNMSYYKRFPAFQEASFHEMFANIARREHWLKEEKLARERSRHPSVKSMESSRSVLSPLNQKNLQDHLHSNDRSTSPGGSSRENAATGGTSSSYSETEL